MKRLVFVSLLILVSCSVKAQELAYTGIITDYLYTNPAFAGSKNVYRVALNSQLRWYNALHKTFYNSFSFDFPFPTNEKFGLGINSQYNQLSTGFIHSGFNVSASYRIGKLRKFIFVPAMRLSYKGYYLNTDNLVFYDQLSIYDGVTDAATNAVIDVRNFHMLGLSAGFALQFPFSFNSTRPVWVYAGYYMDNIPQTTWFPGYNASAYYPPKHTVNLGLLMPVSFRDSKTKEKIFKGIYFSPSLRYIHQNNYDLITVSALGFWKKYLIGFSNQNFRTLNLQNKNQFIGTLGYQGTFNDYLNFQLLYNFDLGLSLNNNSPLFITHEFSIVINFVNKRKNDCPQGLKYNKKRRYNPVDINQYHVNECPPGKTKRRTVKDIFPAFYPVVLPKSYLPDEKILF